jgi:uncharacterized membrane protein YhaH (DUF805 family)
MTEHDQELKALARRIKDLQRVAEPSSWWMNYALLTVFALCLLIFDTQTWLQRLLLLFLALTVGLLLWFCLNRVERDERTRRGSTQKVRPHVG